ncbi:hypothetical protein PYW07_006128 [Mythimna separata]|uniref:Uncharacterized protein n=1 Tax=Mythimna separata TaxID=271217 RepID=A0AAD8DRC3_MYTSE|nr:hypothetical protein PYW07_006128 [Mythimna separata]
MNLQFSEMSVDTSLAQEYLNKNKTLLELCNNYAWITKKYAPFYIYNGRRFLYEEPFILETHGEDMGNTIQKMASGLKQNATLIAQLEYLFRNIPIEVTKAQVDLLIQYLRCYVGSDIGAGRSTFHPDESLLMIGSHIHLICKTRTLSCLSKGTAAISYLLVTLLCDAQEAEECRLYFERPRNSPNVDFGGNWMLQTKNPIRGLYSGTVAVVSDDADVDSAVDKIISVSTKAPWHLRRILVQESVYQQFKDALGWKCKIKPLNSDVLCADALTYTDRTFLLDPVQLTEENPSVVTVEAYRTTKEVISLLQQDKTRYLSLWTNGIAEINEVTHSTKSPVVWVNNVADFRGPPQVAEAVFSYTYLHTMFRVDVKYESYAKLCELSQSWLKLDLERRRDILCGVLDKYILLHPEWKLFAEIKNSLLTCTLKSFVDVGKDYVCIGMSQPLGVLGWIKHTIFSVESFKSILQGNALYVLCKADEGIDYVVFKQAGVPVERLKEAIMDDSEVIIWQSGLDTLTRVIWTNSGTIFAN